MDTFDHLLSQAQASHAAELLLMAGDIPALRVGDHWVRLDHPRCTPLDLLTLAKKLLTSPQYEELQRTCELDFFYSAVGRAAVACNFHFQRGSLVLLVRLTSAAAQPQPAHS